MNIDFNLPLYWKKEFKNFTLHSKDIILTSKNEEFLLTSKSFPLFFLIDGNKTPSEILKSAEHQNERGLFCYLIRLLLKNKKYITQSKESSNIISNEHFNTENYFIKNNNTNKLTSLFKKDVNLYFTRDFHCIELNKKIKKNNYNCIIIELRNNEILISPRLEKHHDFLFFRNALSSNQPVINFLATIYPHSQLRPLDQVAISQQENEFLVQKLYDILLDKIATSNEITFVNVESGITSKHKLLSRTKYYTVKSKVISLSNRKTNYNKDGGYRTIRASQTVSNIMPFVSKRTGLIKSLEKISDNYSIIQIYKTVFNKQPFNNKIDNLNETSFFQICYGKGISKEQSMASALCEAIERKNAQYEDDPICITSTANDLKARFLLFDQLTPYSQSQYTLFADKRHTESNRKQAVLNYDDTVINWQTCWSITNNEPVYVPTVLCFANTPFEEDKFGKWQSNGCAAGNNLEEAILQALFELIERDATAIWWYNKLERPSFDLTRLDPDYLSPLDQTLNKDHNYWVLDLTVDTGVPVMAAIGRHKQSKGLIFGFGCHLKPEMAAQRALTELCQLIPIRNQNGAPFDFDAIEPESYLFANDQAPRGNYALTETLDIKDDILAVVEQLKCLNLETLALDYTRPPIPIHTAKVFVPGLCHIWPQLSNARLYQTPVKLGWLEEPLNEQTINQQGLYI